MQTKIQSLKEATSNVLIGYISAIISQILIFPLFNIETTIQQNLLIGLYFTLISLIRSYLIRRYNNWKLTSKKKNNIKVILLQWYAYIKLKENNDRNN